MTRNPLTEKKLFLFDIDGTIAVGNTLYDGSRALLDHIDAIGGKSYFITNNSTKSGMDYVKKFQSAFDLNVSEDRFITAGFLTIRFLKEHYSQSTIFVVGTASFVAELRRFGLHIVTELVPDIACVVVAYDSELTYEKLCLASELLLTTNVPFYGTNPDLRCPIDFGFIPDCGAICNMLTATTDRIPEYLGKPNPKVVDLCVEASGFSKQETLVIGDRLYTDIACGINAGVDTCVLFTGEATPSDLEDTPYAPTYSFTDVKELLAHLR